MIDFSTLTEELTLEDLEDLTIDQCIDLLYDYELRLRDKQKLPDLNGDWRTWLILAGRSFGKSFAGSSSVNHLVLNHGYRNVGLIGPDISDTRGTMIQKISGIINTCHPSMKPRYYKSDKIALRWQNGAIATVYGATDEEDVRGDNTDLIWMDELCSWKRMEETYTQAMLTNRLGEKPRVIITTTPKPSKLLRQIMEDPQTIVTTGSMFENDTLHESVKETFRRLYEGTKIGRQELYAEILDANEGALFNLDDLEETRISGTNLDEILKSLVRIVIAVDPAVSNNDNSDETGIVVAGKDDNGNAYVLNDSSLKGSPLEWARKVSELFERFKADRVIAEINQGGDLVEHNLRTVNRTLPFKKIRATRGKVLRAEPVAALVEQHKVHLVGGFPQLEDQLTTWVPGQSSPDRMDAFVFAITELLITKGGASTSSTSFGV